MQNPAQSVSSPLEQKSKSPKSLLIFVRTTSTHTMRLNERNPERGREGWRMTVEFSKE